MNQDICIRKIGFSEIAFYYVVSKRSSFSSSVARKSNVEKLFSEIVSPPFRSFDSWNGKLSGMAGVESDRDFLQRHIASNRSLDLGTNSGVGGVKARL